MPDESPLVTIGLPVYNGATYLADALAALERQTVERVEFVISDNASTDGTEEICREFLRRDERFRYSRLPENIGAAGNYNRLVGLARGRFFRWMAHDDLVAPTHLERCLEPFLECEPDLAVVYPRTHLIGPTGLPVGPYDGDLSVTAADPADRVALLVQQLRMCNVVFGLTPTKMLRSTRLIQGFESADKVLMIELAMRGKILLLPERLFYRRLHDQMSRRANPTAKTRAEWFVTDDSAARSRRAMPRSRLFIGYVGGILTSPGSIWQRSRAAERVIRLRFPRERRALLEEAMGFVRASVSLGGVRGRER